MRELGRGPLARLTPCRAGSDDAVAMALAGVIAQEIVDDLEEAAHRDEDAGTVEEIKQEFNG